LNPLKPAPSPVLKQLLKPVKVIAIIGCSSNSYRTSYHIAEYLINSGFEVIPVNPNETEVLDRPCYPSLDDIPGEKDIDLIDIFRNKRYATETVKEIIDWGKKTGQKPVIWTQLDVSTDEAKDLAMANGLEYVENRCLMVEHRW
jgi:predicted CoA-binding protein